nr:hypothetical protein [Micromonospora provocatoris]
MGARFEELAWRETPIGEISLRRRRDPALDAEVYEVKLDDEYLMSSAFPVAEIELARLGLAPLTGDALDVVVGGLGLGYTARTALEDPRVRSLVVVEAIEDVIDWHRRDLLPFAAGLATDPRTRFVRADFFAAVAGGGLDPESRGAASTRCCWTWTTPPARCCTPVTPRSTRPTGCAGWPRCCTRRASSRCGRTTRPTRSSSAR